MRWLVPHVHFMCIPFVYAIHMKCTWDTSFNDIPHMHLGPCADLCLMCSSCAFHSCLSGVSCAFHECMKSPWNAHEMHMGHQSQWYPTHAFRPVHSLVSHVHFMFIPFASLWFSCAFHECLSSHETIFMRLNGYVGDRSRICGTWLMTLDSLIRGA